MSRGGFLGLLVTSVFLLWKLGRNHWRGAVVTAALAGAMLFVLAPGSYRNRLSTLFVSNPEMDSSIEQRMDLLNRGWYLATHHLAIGIGMGNFREYSAENKAAHNSYLEISAELGVAGLLAYLILIVSPFLRLRQMEKSADEFDVHVSAGLQASLIAYAVCGLFLSLEYSWLVYLIVPPAIVLARLERSSIEAFPGAEAVSARQGAIWQSARALGGGVIFNPRGYLWQQR
jgi:O-antigen ligase